MEFEYYDRLINKRTKGRYDVTPIFGDAKAFSSLVDDLAELFRKERFDTIVGIDALGFIIGGAMALRLKKGFVPVRKGGKLPGIKGTVLRVSSRDYTKTMKSFEMSKGSIRKGERVLIVDEWIETGSQVKAAIKLIETQGGKVVGIAALCAERNQKTRILFERYNCRAIGIEEKKGKI
jgi:adenine phosphoribosyltransferase